MKNTTIEKKEQLNIVVVGHVDHGKSTVIGRLLADTGSLPDGKLEQVRATCERNSKPFEYAFLLDALKNEQSQGITIDTARCFFKSDKRDYIIIDAPGHIEFLKNMITGAARAEAAILIIDAKEGVQENSRRHGYMLSMLGIRQVVVCINKMDLVNYAQEAYRRIADEYRDFLAKIGVVAKAIVPIAAFHGENLIGASDKMSWYTQPALLPLMDSFEKEKSRESKPARFPVQDIYKFTNEGDDRRIVAGRVETGSFRAGDEVVFQPSGKKARIESIEDFNRDSRERALAGYSAGFTLLPEIYIKPGEIMAKAGEPAPHVGSRFRANIFWMGRQPLIKGKRYKLKLATVEVPAYLEEVTAVLDASDLSSESHKQQVDLHAVGDIILETLYPIAYDLNPDIDLTGRFVLVDNFEIAGGGIILEDLGSENRLLDEYIARRERSWERSKITMGMRSGRFGQRSTLVLFTGGADQPLVELGKALEDKLFQNNRFVYYLGFSNALLGIQSDTGGTDDRPEYLRRLGEVAHLFTDAGAILVTTVPDLDESELKVIAALNSPGDLLVVNVGDARLSNGVHLSLPSGVSQEAGVQTVTEFLYKNNVLVEYYL